MTLTTHAIVGAGIAAAMPAHPLLGLCAAFASHFALDAIPHIDYHIRSDSLAPKRGGTIQLDRDLLLDLCSIGTDFLLGLVLVVVLFAPYASWPYLALAGFAGMLPDALQFVYLKWQHEPLISLQHFHANVMHTPYRLRAYPIIGWTSQVLFVVLFVWIMRLFVL